MRGAIVMRLRAARAILPAIALLAAPTLTIGAPADPIRIELNTETGIPDHCRLSFVIENKSEAGMSSLKLDLVVFDREGVIDRRLVAEMGPLRATKTIVKTFELKGNCTDIGSILVNGVTACAPGDADSCLDRLALASRVANVRLFK
jgi:hypothetical protein